MDQANTQFSQRGDMAMAISAANNYRKILAENPRNELASCRLAQLLVWIGTQTDGDKEIAYYKEAAQVAENAVRQNPKSPGAHYWLGASYGLWASSAGPIKSLSLVGKVKDAMERLMVLDPSYEAGGAYRILGRLYFKLPFFLGGDNKRAEKMLRQALDMGPHYWLNHLYLADLLRKDGREGEARKLVAQVCEADPIPGLEPETKLWKDMAGKYLRGEADPEDKVSEVSKEETQSEGR